MLEGIAVPEEVFSVTLGSTTPSVWALLRGNTANVFKPMRGTDAARYDSLQSSMANPAMVGLWSQNVLKFTKSVFFTRHKFLVQSACREVTLFPKLLSDFTLTRSNGRLFPPRGSGNRSRLRPRGLGLF